MRWWKWMRMRLRTLVRAESLDRELDEEFRDHLEREVAARVHAGAAPAVARREALIAFGGLDRIREDVHDARGVRLVEDVGQDLRYGVRILRRTPAFAVVVVAILALGIGLTSALFAAVYGVLLKPLPYRNADDVVVLWQSQPSAGHPHDDFSPANFMDLRDETRAFERLAAAWQHGVDYMGDEGPETWQAWAVTEGFFEVLGVDAAAGRLFAAADHVPDAPPSLLLTHEFWQSRFGAEPGVVGTRVTLDDVVWEIAGVLPAAFRFPTRTQVFLPAAMTEAMREQRGATYLTVVGQLPPGATPGQLEGELDALAQRLSLQYPRTNAGVDFVSVPLAEQITGDIRPLLVLLMSAVALLLLVACSNVANLFLARTTAREGEFALRGALGARGLRLARQLLAECAVLAAAGGAAGLLLAYYGVALIRAFAPADLPRLEEITFEPRVAAFAVVVSSLTVFIFALLPALRASRVSLHGGMLSGSARATPGLRRRRASRMLVVAEVAFSFVLVLAAGLVVRSFVKLTSVDPGYRTEGVATMSIFLWGRYNSPEQQVTMITELEARVRALPGIVAFGASTSLPMHERIGREDADVVAEGAVVAPGEAAVVRGASVTPGYFDALHIPLLRGRLFTTADDARGEPVALISESLASQHFPGLDPIGRTITVSFPRGPVTRRIAGVVGDVRHTGLDEAPRPAVYVPFRQAPDGAVVLTVRGSGDAAALVPAVSQAIWAIAPTLPLYSSATLEDLRKDSLQVRRFVLLLLALFAVSALLLAALGVYGVLNNATTERAREIGLRLALGARTRTILTQVVASGVVLALGGIAIGCVAAVAATGLLRSVLFGVGALDPVTFAGAAATLLAAAAMAALVPAWRAARVDPASTLKG